MKTVKRIAALFALMFTAAAWAVDAPTPVALWNGDFNETTKGNYTLSANGNTVAADGSSITISTTATKGVQVAWSTSITPSLTVIVKHAGLPAHSTLATLAAIKGGQPTSYNDNRVGVNLQANTSYKTIGYWNGGTGGRLTPDAEMDPAATTYALKYHAVRNDANRGTYLIQKNTDGSTTQIYYEQGLVGSGDVIDGVTIGGNAANAGSNYANFEIIGIAIFDSLLTDADIAAYEFPKAEEEKKVEPVALFNFGYTTEEDGWYNYRQSGGHDLGPVTTNGVSFSATKDIGNFFYTSNTDFGEVNTDFAGDGTYADVFGVEHATIQEEIKTSLGLSGIDFTTAVYKSGQMNGGYTDHPVSVSGLDANSKYVLYAGFGMLRTQYNEQVMGVQIDASGYSTVDALEYVTTVEGQNATVATSYQTFTAGTVLKCGSQGLMVVRLKNVMPKADGSVAFTFRGDKGGINFLAVAKVNEIEEPEETETINYTATGFVTKTYQQTGWNTTIDEILQYGTLTPTMSGGYMNPKPVTGAAQFITKTTEGSDAVLSMQMQVVNDGHLKVVEIYLKDSDNGVLIKATRAGHTTGAALGTNQTSFGDQVAENANANGYGVASVALSITKPVNKSVKGTIGEVTTEHSEDYTSNTITAKVTIENEGEYKGEAVLVYVLNGTTNEVAVAEGQTTLTINGLEQEKVYRGTLALGQKLEGGTVVVIEGIEVPVALYQGEQKFVWNDKSIVLKTASTISDGAGCTIKPVCNDPDYVDLCDSEYIVSLSASESVDADDESLEGVQGGVRIAKVDDALELQIIDNGQWTNLADATVDTSYTLTVKFHYNKGEGDEEGATSVTYTLDSTTKEATNKTDKLKVTEVFIADGTVLPNDLTGLFQLDKAVVADVEIVIDHDESAEIDAKNLDAAQAIADKMVVAISEEVAKVVSAETYRGYFKVVAKQGTDGKFHAVVEFAPGVQEAIEDDIEEAMEKVVSGFSSGSAEIAAKPGLYYGVKRGDDLNNLNIEETTLATSEKVTITITKPDTSKSHFYRIIVSPTPATK